MICVVAGALLIQFEFSQMRFERQDSRCTKRFIFSLLALAFFPPPELHTGSETTNNGSICGSSKDCKSRLPQTAHIYFGVFDKKDSKC